MPGDVVDFQPDQAVRLIQSGQGEAVPDIAETAVKPSSEAAVVPSPTPGRKKKKRS